MAYISIPFLLMVAATVGYSLARCHGSENVLHTLIFFAAVAEFSCQVLTIPVMPDQVSAMFLLSFILAKIILSILSYESYYRKNLDELSLRLLHEESQKELSELQAEKEKDSPKIIAAKLAAHFIGEDGYALLMSKVAGQQLLKVDQHNVFLALLMAFRLLPLCLMAFLLSTGAPGDGLLMPLFVMVLALLATGPRVLQSEKVQALLARWRGRE